MKLCRSCVCIGVVFVASGILGCSDGEPVVIEHTEQYQPTPAEVAAEQETDRMREERSEIDR